MIYRIIGRAKSGKTSYLLDELKTAHENGKSCILLVPEQQSIAAERALCALLGSEYNLSTEVLNFERLPDRVFRENGGVALSRADSQTLSLFTALACEKAKERLSIYEKSALEREFTKKISSSLERMKTNGVTPRDLIRASSLLEDDGSAFKDKLSDISEIFTEYNELLKKGYPDRVGVIDILCNQLSEKNFFNGKTVFIDGYYNFTPAQYPIVELLLKGADDTYITVLYDEKDKSGIFDINKKTLELTEKIGKGVENIYPQIPSCRTPSLSFLEKNVFSSFGTSYQGTEGIKILPCSSVFEESECIAEEIVRLVKNGYRFKDIAIAVRDSSRFDGILDSALQRYNIPFYQASKDNLSTKEISSLILSLLEIAHTDWSLSSVLKYIGSSFSTLTDEESDLLSIYANVWQIRGRKWYSGEEWVMNPSGYKSKFSVRETKMLSTVNMAREKLMLEIGSTIEDLKRKNLTISEAILCIYNHLISIKADKTLMNRANELIEKGEDDEAAKISAVWDSIMSIFDTLFETAGTEKATSKRLLDILRLMMDEYKLGAIPSYYDIVELGNASIMRPSSCKVIIIAGVNDGVFPANPQNADIFSNSEKEFLKTVGIESETLPDDYLKNEFLLFYNLVSAAEKELILTYSLSTLSGKREYPSTFIDTVTRIMGNKCVKTFKKRQTRIGNPGNTFSLDVSILPSPNKSLNLSATKIEKYLNCPFSYFCDYILELQPYEVAKIRPNVAGEFVHKVLELFVKHLFETGEFKSKNSEEIENFISNVSMSCLKEFVLGTESQREKFCFDHFSPLLLPLLENLNSEFQSGGFIPKDYEVRINTEYDISPTSKLHFVGYADRIDTLKIGNDEYIRIVDYKTYSKSFSLDLVKEGFDMQMPLYLFAYCKNKEIPAGIMYFNCGFPSPSGKPFARNGIVLDTPSISDATDFLKSNSLLSKTSFKPSEVFCELKQTVNENIRKIGKEILDGHMEIKPTEVANKNPCKFCNARLYCRKMLKSKDDN